MLNIQTRDDITFTVMLIHYRLSVRDVTKEVKILRDTMGYAEEITVLIIFSQREKIF